MDKEAKLLRRELSSLEELKFLETEDLKRDPKSAETSKVSRKKGNDLYVKQHHTAQEHLEILKLYSKSIAFAPADSEELALAYGNRSALLLHLKKFTECVEDVERALKITRTDNLKDKFKKRRALALEKREKEEEESSSPLTPRVDPHDSVQVNYNEKYGRFLVAKRDISPGEIIFAEKPYINSVNTKKLYSHCAHCLIMTWSAIPCEYCAWFMYCSEECKREAWQQYHDVECFCIFQMIYFVNYANEKIGHDVCFDGLGIRAMIKGMREAGDLEKLKEQLRSVDACSDRRTRGFSKKGRFESSRFISLYSLSSFVSALETKSYVTFAVITLVCLAKYTKFFGDAFDFVSITKLMENPDALFVGSLILRLSKISKVNSHCVLNTTDQCEYSRDSVSCRQNWCCVRGACIVPIASLTNNSCCPNAKRCFTDDQTFILYAIQPIKTNTQIYDSYYCSYYEGRNPMRRNALKQDFNFECDCLACKKDWPCFPVLQTSSKELSERVKLSSKEIALWKEYQNVVENVENKTVPFDRSLLQSISKATEKSASLLQPSAVNCKISYALIQVFEKLYGYKMQLCSEC